MERLKKVLIFKESGFRCPKSGEWFVGFDGLLHQAQKDLDLVYQIFQPVSEFFLRFQ